MSVNLSLESLYFQRMCYRENSQTGFERCNRIMALEHQRKVNKNEFQIRIVFEAASSSNCQQLSHEKLKTFHPVVELKKNKLKTEIIVVQNLFLFYTNKILTTLRRYIFIFNFFLAISLTLQSVFRWLSHVNEFLLLCLGFTWDIVTDILDMWFK